MAFADKLSMHDYFDLMFLCLQLLGFKVRKEGLHEVPYQLYAGVLETKIEFFRCFLLFLSP